MNTAYSSNRPTHEYQPTIIESRVLIRRLAIQISFLKKELEQNWIDCNKDPIEFTKRSARDLSLAVKRLLTAPNALPSLAAAIVAVASIVIVVLMFERAARLRDHAGVTEESPVELVYLDVNPQSDSMGINGQGRVGFNTGRGEGSGPKPKPAQGGGGGGNDNPLPQQTGKLPPPSNIFAAIPTRPPLSPPALPVAGIDIDPALWSDIKAPVFGDPRSTSTVESKGPGKGEGIGTGKGLGVGEGDGPGVGDGKDGNTGGGSKNAGCCGPSGGKGEAADTFRQSEVEQRARLLLKPEPKYTEEARRNQVTGTVMLRVVFSSSGEVVQIRAVRSLPFGLTERAIAAAREIKFVPAVKGGRPVSVSMQLEYNFNLY